MAKNKSTLNFYKDSHDKWQWRVYDKTGTIISLSIEGYEKREDAENNLRLTMMAAIDATLQALKIKGLTRMKSSVVGLAETASVALEALRDTDIVDKYSNLTKKGRKLLQEDIEQEIRRETEAIEQSKAIPALDQEPSIHIPVQNQSVETYVQVRLK